MILARVVSAPTPVGPDLQEATPGDGSGEDLVPSALLRRDRLTRDGSLVQPAGAGNDLSVDWNLGPVLDQHRLTHHDADSGDLDLLALAHDHRDIRGDGNQLGQRRPCLVQRGHLKGVADAEQERDRGGLPVLTDDHRTYGGHTDQQVDADHPRRQRPGGLEHDLGSGQRRCGHHEDVAHLVRAEHPGHDERHDDQQTGDHWYPPRPPPPPAQYAHFPVLPSAFLYPTSGVSIWTVRGPHDPDHEPRQSTAQQS
jgi:hypothetical protein